MCFEIYFSDFFHSRRLEKGSQRWLEFTWTDRKKLSRKETGNRSGVRWCSASPPLKLPVYTLKYLNFVFCLLLDHQLPEVSLVQDPGQCSPLVTGAASALRSGGDFSLWIPRSTGLESIGKPCWMNDAGSKCYLCQRRGLHFCGFKRNSRTSPKERLIRRQAPWRAGCRDLWKGLPQPQLTLSASPWRVQVCAQGTSECSLGENGYMYMPDWVPLLSTQNYHNIVNQLYPKIKLKV